MSDTEQNEVSVSLPKPSSNGLDARSESSAAADRPVSPVNANTELDQVKQIMKTSTDQDPLEDKSIFYPLQQKTAYMPPVCTLTSESKKIVRQAQTPILQASPRVVHFLYEARIEELEEELEKERKARIKAEKNRADLSREVEDLGYRLEETSAQASTQTELSRRREGELNKTKRELEIANTNHDEELNMLRRKNHEVMQEMQEQIENLTKAKTKTDKDNAHLTTEVADLRASVENAQKLQANTEKHNKQLESQVAEVNKKLDDANRTIGDMEVAKRKIELQKIEAEKQYQEAESQLASMEKIKDQLKKELEEAKTQASHESQERLALLSKYRSLEIDLEAARKLIEDDEAIKNNLHNQLSKAHAEVQAWKAKFESAGYVLREEMEEMRKKLTIRLQEADDHIEQLNIKNSTLEKQKQKLHNECEEMANELESARVLVITLEKRLKAADKEISEWKQRCDDLASELDASQKECRNLTTDLFKVKAAYEELQETHDATKRENKNLQDEVKDLLDQLSEASRNIQDLELTRKRLTMEKEELQNALAEAETALEVEQNKVYAAQQALEQAKLEHDRLLREKEEEFEGVRRNMQKALDQMQMSLEQEARGRAEALKAKKKLESDIVELEMALDAAQKAHAEAQNFIHKLQNNLKEMQVAFDHEMRAKEEAQELYAQCERKCHNLHNELDQTRTILELAERKCRNLENELAELSEVNTDLNAANAALSNSKRKLEGEHTILKSDFEEALNEAKMLDDKYHKAMLDAARLADELRDEQEHAQQQSSKVKSLEEQLKDTQIRLEEAEQAAMIAGRKTIAKLEVHVRELNSELENEKRRHCDASKNLRKTDRVLKELRFEKDEIKKQNEHLQDLCDKLSQKVKAYKRQIEEAEEIAALNMAKFRKVQNELEEAEERADSTQQNLAKIRAKTRSSISMNRAASPTREYDSQKLLKEVS